MMVCSSVFMCVDVHFYLQQLSCVKLDKITHALYCYSAIDVSVITLIS